LKAPISNYYEVLKDITWDDVEAAEGSFSK
jgi:hypothetical protein